MPPFRPARFHPSGIETRSATGADAGRAARATPSARLLLALGAAPWTPLGAGSPVPSGVLAAAGSEAASLARRAPSFAPPGGLPGLVAQRHLLVVCRLLDPSHDPGVVAAGGVEGHPVDGIAGGKGDLLAFQDVDRAEVKPLLLLAVVEHERRAGPRFALHVHHLAGEGERFAAARPRTAVAARSRKSSGGGGEGEQGGESKGGARVHREISESWRRGHPGRLRTGIKGDARGEWAERRCPRSFARSAGSDETAALAARHCNGCRGFAPGPARSTVVGMDDLRANRWEVGAVIAAVGAAAALVALGWTAARGLAESRESALDGRVLRFAHRIEAELRDVGPAAAPGLLATMEDENADWIEGIALATPEGDWERRAGASVARLERDPDQRVELSLGRTWGGGPPSAGLATGGGWRGARASARRTLGIWVDAAARRPSLVERALLPASSAAAAALVGLALVAVRGARRERARELEAVDRRRLEGLGRAGAGLAHQLRNPLATVKGSCQLLLEESDGDSRPRLERILGEVDRMDRLLAELLDYARPPTAEPAMLQLEPFLAEIARGDERVVVACPPHLAATVDPEHLREILVNLLDNARAVSDDGSRIEVVVRRRGRLLETDVADRGPGPGSNPEAWFEPYATGRHDGTGLGLPIARALAMANGGSLELVARPGGGAVARLRLLAVEGGA